MPCLLQFDSSVAPPGTSAYHDDSAAVVGTNTFAENSDRREVKVGTSNTTGDPVLPLGVVMVIMMLDPGTSKNGCNLASEDVLAVTGVGLRSVSLVQRAAEYENVLKLPSTFIANVYPLKQVAK